MVTTRDHPTLSTPRQQPADNLITLELLASNTSRGQALGSLGSPEVQKLRFRLCSFRHEFFRASGPFDTSTKRRRPRSLHPQDPTPGQPAAKDEHSAEFLRIVEFPHAVAFAKNLLERKVDCTHPHAFSGVFRQLGEDSVVGNYLTRTRITHPYVSSSSSQWQSIHIDELCGRGRRYTGWRYPTSRRCKLHLVRGGNAEE